jgi:hypothetical protein
MIFGLTVMKGAGVPIGCACVWRRNSKSQWVATVIRK